MMMQHTAVQECWRQPDQQQQQQQQHRMLPSRQLGHQAAPWPPWLLVLLMLQAALHPAAAADGDPAPPHQAAAANSTTAAAAATATRFFIDEGYFLEGDTEILRAYISASAGRMAISGESTAAFLSVKGYYSPETWDVYWTIRQACHMAYQHMQHHQMVNCIPGVSAMSLKRTFISTWQQAYGERAFGHIPRSYLLPEQYWLWRSHLLAAVSPPDRKWVLKANIHRGKGVAVLPQREALSHALTHKHEPHGTDSSGSGSSTDGVHYLNVLVQSYLQQQLVIAGRSSYIRVWLLVTSINPLRAYLFDGGFAIFGKQKGPATATAPAPAAAGASSKAPSSSSSSTDDLIVNLWIQDRNSSPIWSLQHLQEYIKAHPDAVLPLPDSQQQQQQQGDKAGRLLLQANSSSSSSRRTFADAWSDMQTSASMVLAAALPAMRAAAAESSAPQQGTFEYFGLDFVFDAYLRPWMLEVNAIPSMARRKKSDCAGETATASCKLKTAGAAAAAAASNSNRSSAAAAAPSDDFDAQKEQFVHDMLVLLGLPVDSSSSSSRTAGAGASPSDAAGMLRMAAAAAAAAGIRSAPPPAATPAANSSSSRQGSAGGSTDRRLLMAAARQMLQHARHHHRPHNKPSAATAGSSSSDLKLEQQQQQQQGYKGVAGLQWSGPAPDPKQLPPQLQKLLCTASSSSSGGGFACISCFTADDLAALAAAEGELQRAGRFVPVHDLITAHTTNRQALQDARADAAATAAVGQDTAGATDSSSTTPAGTAAAAAPAGVLESGGSYLSPSRSVWQKLYRAWKGMSQGHVGVGDLAVMQYYTTASTVSAHKGLQLRRLDYVMSAWLRVRREEGCAGLQAADCVMKRLGLVVSRCYLHHR